MVIVLDTPKYLSKQKCEKGCEGTFANSPYEDTISARDVELHDTETSNDPPIMNVILFNNCAMDVPYVAEVKIIGSIQRVKIKDKLLPHLFVGLESDDSTTNDFNPIECPDRIELVVITPDDEKKIQEFVIQNKGRVLDALVDLVEPSHIGHEDAKKGLLMCAASTGINTKRRINLLLIGETGEAKTPLAKGSARLVPGSKFAAATDSTTNTLICVVDNETRHFRIGPVVTSNRAILGCCQWRRVLSLYTVEYCI